MVNFNRKGCFSLKKLFCVLLTIVLCISLVACGKEAEPNTTPVTYAEQVYSIKDNILSFTTYGRTKMANLGLNCDHSASGIAFTAYMEGDVSIIMNNTGDCYFTLYIDGVRNTKRIEVPVGQRNEVKLTTFLEGGVHTIQLLKQTEESKSLCTLISVKFTGSFEAPPAKSEKLVEIIGDSISAGMANLCANGVEDAGNAVHEDATLTYGFLTAQKLNAEARIIARSGIGIVKGGTTYNMDDYFFAESYNRDISIRYEPDRVPDLLIINLGTNDGGHGVTADQLKDKVPALIRQIRQLYGKDVPIVWVHAMMWEGMWSAIEPILDKEFGGEDGGIYYFEAPTNRDGGANHPTVSAHKETSELLSQFIKDKGLI